MRFQREQHLRKQMEFQKVRASGIRRECGFFLLQIHIPDSPHPPLRRLGVIASRRVGNAVTRNRCKRILREVFRQHQDRLPPNCDLVLVARRRLANAEFADAERAFLKLTERFPEKT